VRRARQRTKRGQKGRRRQQANGGRSKEQQGAPSRSDSSK